MNFFIVLNDIIKIFIIFVALKYKIVFSLFSISVFSFGFLIKSTIYFRDVSVIGLLIKKDKALKRFIYRQVNRWVIVPTHLARPPTHSLSG